MSRRKGTAVDLETWVEVSERSDSEMLTTCVGAVDEVLTASWWLGGVEVRMSESEEV